MKKKTILLFAVSVLISLNTTVKAASAQVERLWGSDRYKTCSEIVNKGWQNSEYAVIVNGSNFPDALSAAALAKKYNAPILLTGSEKLESNTYNQINRLNIKTAFIVGGIGVVSPTLQAQLNAMNIKTERFSGLDRTSTSVEVAKKIGTSNGVILTTDSSYTDALSASPIAAKLQIPIILMPKNSVPDSVKSFIEKNNITKTYVIGGEDLISSTAVSNFPNVERITGNDEYERNINIIKEFSDRFNFNSAFIASSKDFADALSGSAFAAIDGNPIILAGDTLEGTTKDFIASKNFAKLYVLGGTAGISDNTVTNITNVGQATNKDNQGDNNQTPNNNDNSNVDQDSSQTSHSELQKNLYNYFLNKDNRDSVMKRAIELHDGDTSNNCVYFASEGLRRAGLTDLPEDVCNTGDFTNQLKNRGWVQSEDLSKLCPGDICFTTNGPTNVPTHTYTFMDWVKDNVHDYAYVCDNQAIEYGDSYHKRPVEFPTPTKEAIAYFMYKQ